MNQNYDENGRKYYTVTNCCRLLGISETTLRKLMAQGKLKSVKVGRGNRIYGDDIEHYLANNELPRTHATKGLGKYS